MKLSCNWQSGGVFKYAQADVTDGQDHLNIDSRIRHEREVPKSFGGKVNLRPETTYGSAALPRTPATICHGT